MIEEHKEHRHKNEITLKKSTLWKVGTFLFLGLFIVSLLTGGFKGRDNPRVPSERVIQGLPSGNSGQPTINMKTLADDDPVKGSENAPVTIIEFSDFQCPFCGRFFSQTLPLIESNYIKTGKVKLIFRDFPLGFHQYAQKSAEAAECADEQGKFWEYHDKIFENQAALSSANLKQWASEIGLDTNKFNDCLDSGKMASEVKKDMSDGTAVGIRGTPGFIINGKLVSGAQPFSVFQQIIDAELAK